MTATSDDLADDLLAYIAVSPTPWHAVQESVRRLEAAGYRNLDEDAPWSLAPGDRVYVVRAGSSLAALHVGGARASEGGFRIVGAHTDSPNLRIKPNPDVARSGYRQLGVEVYGGVLLTTWLDRDLSLAGRVVVRTDASVAVHLVDFRRALMRIPNLAIHLNRTVNADGLVVNAQQHLPPILAIEDGDADAFDLRGLLSAELRRSGVVCEPSELLGWDLCLYDAQPPSRIGARGELLSAARLDNLGSCHAALTSLAHATSASPATRAVVLYDHEEVGSRSAQGAMSPFLRSVLERVVEARDGAGADAFTRAMRRSFLVSADMAHAIHPNYADRHDPEHKPVLGHGPVVKTNANQSYATDGVTWARFEAWCREADVTPQHFVVRSDLPCGSTIGPITAAELGMRTIDVGNPMLSMHSCRETAGAADVPKMIAVLDRFFADTTPLP